MTNILDKYRSCVIEKEADIFSNLHVFLFNLDVLADLLVLSIVNPAILVLLYNNVTQLEIK